ncbi:MAG TPA: hypothetical protein VKS98_11800 [Chthoniobacterales bacterium]|nr:hypothetical protein [Chthoniobacterales bacterium]
MAESHEPKKETVRIMVSPSAKPAASSVPGRQTVRIQLPTRPPPDPPPAPDSPSPVRAAAAAMPAPMTTHSPKKETARITVLPDPPVKPPVEMKKTQPLIDLPRAEGPVTKVNVVATPQPALRPVSEPAPQMRINDLPMPLCWGLLATSAAILILQIWNYLS